MQNDVEVRPALAAWFAATAGQYRFASTCRGRMMRLARAKTANSEPIDASHVRVPDE